ncbi:MAG: SDR family oxidoreductase [Solirubrobacterales bacterium]|nr:SDR family oxidoreductase [Solirubrobacterales bacterium]
MADGGTASSGAVVTGGARGLGFEIAKVLASRGHVVHLTDVDGAAADRAAAELGSGAFASVLDVRDEEACRAIASETVRRAGSLAVWVNNAGVLITGPAWEQDSNTRRLMLEVNAVGTINGTLAALEQMRAAQGGHIVNVVSLAGLVAAPGEAIYGSSKHAAIGFSLGTLADLRVAGVRGIDISCICPDGIWTPMLQDKLDDPAAAASFTGVLLLPRQVAERVGWLLDHPRPVLVVPRWRGPVIRSFDRWPRLAVLGARPVLALGRLQQRIFALRVRRGNWPPRS